MTHQYGSSGWLLLLLSVCLLEDCRVSAQNDDENGGFEGFTPSNAAKNKHYEHRWRLGEVKFKPTSSNQLAGEYFELGLTQLHSFVYAIAGEAFRRARTLDPDMAMAYWGEAMSHNTIFWGKEEIEEGRAVLNLLQEREPVRMSPVEQQLIVAARALFFGESREQRLAEYLKIMKQVAHDHPDNDEVQLFYALHLITRAFPYQRGFMERFGDTWDEAKTLLERVGARSPRHPGYLHYSIHLHDTPDQAANGLPHANAYGKVASSAPHAVHMPSHIYLRLGMWKEAEQANEQAMLASDLQHRALGWPASMTDMHNIEFLHYCVLQQGKYHQGTQLAHVMSQLADVSIVHDRADVNGQPDLRYYTMISRGVVERGLMLDVWDEEPYPFTAEGVQDGEADLEHVETFIATHFACIYHALAIGREEKALELTRDYDQFVEKNVYSRPQKPYFSPHGVVEIMRLQIHGLIEYYRKDAKDSTERGTRWNEDWLPWLRKALELETSTDPPGYDPVFPIIPSGELLGTLLLRQDPQIRNNLLPEALRSFEATLRASPNRPGTLLGLSRVHLELKTPHMFLRYHRLFEWVFAQADYDASYVGAEMATYVSDHSVMMRSGAMALWATLTSSVLVLALLMVTLVTHLGIDKARIPQPVLYCSVLLFLVLSAILSPQFAISSLGAANWLKGLLWTEVASSLYLVGTAGHAALRPRANVTIILVFVVSVFSAMTIAAFMPSIVVDDGYRGILCAFGVGESLTSTFPRTTSGHTWPTHNDESGGVDDGLVVLPSLVAWVVTLVVGLYGGRNLPIASQGNA